MTALSALSAPSVLSVLSEWVTLSAPSVSSVSVLAETVWAHIHVGAAAAGVPVQQPPAGTPTVDQVLTNVRNWIMGILASVATVAWTVAGLRYIAANGEVAQVEKAKAAVKAGAIGYALAALAPLLTAILRSILGA